MNTIDRSWNIVSEFKKYIIPALLMWAGYYFLDKSDVSEFLHGQEETIQVKSLIQLALSVCMYAAGGFLLILIEITELLKKIKEGVECIKI